MSVFHPYRPNARNKEIVWWQVHFPRVKIQEQSIRLHSWSLEKPVSFHRWWLAHFRSLTPTMIQLFPTDQGLNATRALFFCFALKRSSVRCSIFTTEEGARMSMCVVDCRVWQATHETIPSSWFCFLMKEISFDKAENVCQECREKFSLLLQSPFSDNVSCYNCGN